MPKFNVEIIKPVTDYLRGYVEVEAATADEAVAKALDDMSIRDNVRFEFWQHGDCLEETTATAKEIGPDGEPVLVVASAREGG